MTPTRLRSSVPLVPLLVALLVAGCGQNGGLAIPEVPEDAGTGSDASKRPLPDASPWVVPDATPPDGPVTQLPPPRIDAGEPKLDADPLTTDGAAPSCVPGREVECACTNGRIGAQLCNAQGQFSPCRCLDDRLARLRQGVLGTWKGTVTTPWQPPYAVTITFEADGHYSAHCVQLDVSCRAFYWGSDLDTPEKRYDIQDVRADGKGTAEILIWFDPGNVNHGQLRSIDLSADGNTLTFEAWKDSYGPLKFALTRAQ